MLTFRAEEVLAQCDCAVFASDATVNTLDIVPYCDELVVRVSIQNYDVINECSGDPLVRLWLGTTDVGPGAPALQDIQYLGNPALVYSDGYFIAPYQFRRFYFNLSELAYLESTVVNFRFAFRPSDFDLADDYLMVVEVLNQDTISCGNEPDELNQHFQYFSIANHLTERPISGTVSSLIAASRLLSNSFSNPIVESKIIRGGLDVNQSYSFDGPGGINGRPQLYLGPGDQIIVRTGDTLNLINADIFTCDTLAYGIVVESGAKLYAENCNLNDSRFAIDAKPGAILELINNTFTDNFIGLNLDMSSGTSGSRRVFFNTMEGNVFQSDFGLKTPYSGMPEAVEYRGYCGIQLKNYEHFNVGSNQAFIQLANGIIGQNSTGNITNMSFFDMNSVDQTAVYPREGYGIHLLGKGGSYWFNINQTYTSMSFDNCKTGVYAKSYAGRVAGTTMTDVGTGIEWLLSNNRDIFFRENVITARQFGVKTFLNEPVHSYSIMENNTITVSEGLDDGNNSVGAIVMDEIEMGSDPYGPIPVTKTADGWEVKGSTITMEKGGNGILYRNGVNGIVNANSISNESEPNDYKGINTYGSFFIGVSNNTIFQEHSVGLGTAFGIYSAGGQANTFQCNCIDKTNVGMQFFDMADFPNAVRGNNFNRHCTGLQLGFDGVGGTIIGDQVHAGNLWDLSAITGSCLGARNHGGNDDIPKSEFFVNGNANAALNPSVFPTTDWFFSVSGTTYSGCSSCSFPTTIPTRITETNTPTAFDFEVASGNYTTGVYTNEMLWKARYRLFRKLLRRPALESYDSVFITFKSGYQNTSFAKLAFIAEQKAQLFNLTEVQDSILENRRISYRFYDNDLRILDSLVQVGATVSETTYNNTKGFAVSALGSYEDYADALHTLRVQKILTLDSLNNLVSTVLTPDANQKTVNAILFDFLLADTLETGNLATLETIAEQCPLEGGDAVYEARAVVGYFTGEQYDDEVACNVQSRESLAKNAQIASDFIKVYPNPTTGKLLWESNEEGISSIRVYNTLGQLQLQQPASDQRIELSGLVDGLYWVQFMDANSKILATKAVHLIRN